MLPVKSILRRALCVAFVAALSVTSGNAQEGMRNVRIAANNDVGASGVYEMRKQQMNENVITIISSGSVSPYTKMAEDIQNVVDEPKSTGGLRVLPILGRGGAHNALDILLLKGVDMGVMEKDDILKAKQDEPVILSNAEQRIQYITKLANSEFQIIAGANIKTIRDLEGKKVNFFKKLSSTDVACRKVFGLLNIHVQPVHYDQSTASSMLRKGEIAAFARFAPAPHGAFQGFKAKDGFHFLSIDTDVVSDNDFIKLLEFYSPALLKNEVYPDLVPPSEPVTTVAGSLLLAIYAWPPGTERYNRASRFVNNFFNKIDQFKKPGRHPKWKEINLAYKVPGWTRFRPAQEWLDAHKTFAKPASSSDGRDMRAAFEEFMGKNASTNTGQFTPEQRNEMFKAFLTWWKMQKAPR